MSNTTRVTSAAGGKPAAKTNGKKTPKAPKETAGKRKGRQQIIFEAMDGKSMLPTDIESACQKVKPATSGAYSRAAKRWFVEKDGRFFPELKDDRLRAIAL